MSASLTFADVSFRFRDQGREREVLRNFSLEFTGGVVTTVIGRNGAGKSTLLQLAAGCLKPDVGEIRLPFPNLSRRPIVSMVWQNYRESLMPWLSAAQNVGFPIRVNRRNAAEARRAGAEILRRFASDVKPDARIRHLSGGQQQKVALLRSVAIDADLYLYDEPFTAIDVNARWALADDLNKLWSTHTAPVVIVTHDVDEAVWLADRVVCLPVDPAQKACVIINNMARPRTSQMLKSADHLILRGAVLDHLHAG